MRLSTDAMRRGLSLAVVELRARLGWGQEDLAQAITRQGARLNLTLAPDRITISRWENRERSPSPEHRMVLARIAVGHGHEDLAELFRAPVSAWRLVGVVKLGLKDEG